MEKMKITTKQIKTNEFETEIRYFAETNDDFDGNAQGYGYKSIEKLKKAHWFYKNKGKLRSMEHQAKKFLKSNPEIKKLLNDYFSADNHIYALKNREELSFDGLITELRDGNWTVENREETIKKIEESKHLWKSILYVI